MAWAREYRQEHPSGPEVQLNRQFSGDFAYLPCAPGCRGSGSDPRFCHCVCQGINHGILIYGRAPSPVPVPKGFTPYLAFRQEPEHFLPSQPLQLPAPQPIRTEKHREPKGERYGSIFGKAIGRSFKHAFAGYSQDELNAKILKGLAGQFNPERVEAIVNQAFTVFFARVGSDSNRPELYELYENGDIDRALETFEDKPIRWVFGRPKIGKKR